MLLLLLVALGLFWMLFAYYRVRLGFERLSIRGSLVLAYLAFQLVLLAITEITSIGDHFTHWTVACLWLAVCAGLLLAVRIPLAGVFGRLRSRQRIRSEISGRFGQLGGEEWFWIGVVVLILGVLAVKGSFYPPSNSDSLVYHLARVEHWIQNRSIAPFSTHYLAQIDLSPLSEYNLAHLQLLSGTDRFDWTMQWTAAAISLVGVSELARLLGGSRMVQIVAAVVCATIPSGILLAASTENDYFTAAIGIGLLVLLAGFSFGRGWVYRAVALGTTAGLSYMAKGTAPVMFAPAVLAFVALAAFRLARSKGKKITARREIWFCAIGVAGVALVVGPFMLRNSQVTGSLTGATSKTTISSPITLAGFGANVVRSTAANFDIGDGTRGVDTYLSKILLPLFHQMYSVFGVSQHDHSYALGQYVDTFAVQSYSYAVRASDVGADPWHVLLIVMALIVLVVAGLRGSKDIRVPLMLGVALACGYLLFMGSTRWSQYSLRYTVPLLVAWSAIIAIALARSHRWVTRFVLIGLTVACLPQLLDSANQPLVPPKNFAGQPYLLPYFSNIGVLGNPNFGVSEASAYETVTGVLAQSTCHRAAITNWVIYEYPLWVALGHEHWTGTLNDVDVHNPSAKLEPRYQPCAWISEQGARYTTPSKGTATVQEGNLAISMTPDDAASVHTAIPGFSSTTPGAHMLPGGGWSLAGLGHLLLLGSHGSLYVFSGTTQKAFLELDLVPGFAQPSVVVADADGREIPSTVAHDTVRAELELRSGVDRFELTTEPSSATARRLMALTGMNLEPPGR